MPVSPANDPFVGRDVEIEQLHAALGSALQGQGRIVMLTGEPGIGKTRLTEQLIESAKGQGFAVLWGRCYEDRGAPPCWPWTQILRNYISTRDPSSFEAEMGGSAGVIADILPELRARIPNLEPALPMSDPESARFRLLDATSRFLVTASHSQPMLLILDDIHWADDLTLRLLQLLLATGHSGRVPCGDYDFFTGPGIRALDLAVQRTRAFSRSH